MALGPPEHIFDESDLSDCSSTIVEPSTSTRASPFGPSPVPSPCFPTFTARPGLDLETSEPSPGAADEGPAMGQQDTSPENQSPDNVSAGRDDTGTDMPPTVAVSDQETSQAPLESPGHPFLFDFEGTHFTASPQQTTPTRKRSRNEFESDIAAALDPELWYADQGLGVWGTTGETESPLGQGSSRGADSEVSAAASPIPETDTPEGAHDEEDEYNEAGGSKAPLCKRRRL